MGEEAVLTRLGEALIPRPGQVRIFHMWRRRDDGMYDHKVWHGGELIRCEVTATGPEVLEKQPR